MQFENGQGPDKEPIIDLLTGISLNLPLGSQLYPYWWENEPEKYAYVLARREELGITGIDDDLWERTPDREMVSNDPHEVKAIVRTPEGAKKYGQPIGSVIVPNKLRPGKAVKKIKRAEKPAQANGGKPKPRAAARAKGVAERARQRTTNTHELRAWGPSDPGMTTRRNARVVHEVSYVKSKELEKARKIAIERTRALPKPERHDIADNKHLLKTGGTNQKDEWGRTINDNLRGNNSQRSANSWAVYVAFGGIDAKGNDRGYVPCVGCGMKMTWHNNADYSDLPKFEQDKIITTRDGGQYVPQNLVPCCAGCNNQRGERNLWDVPAFKGSRPSWYTRAFDMEVRSIRPKKRNLAKGEKRPVKEVPVWYMPVPPGVGKNRGTKSFNSVGNRARNMLMRAMLSATAISNPQTGDRVQAELWNFDGNRPYAEVPPPGKVVGELFIEQVESAFGNFEQYVVITDRGEIRIVEPASVLLVGKGPEHKAHQRALRYKVAGGSNGPAPGASEGLNAYWTRGPGLAKWAKSPHPYRALVKALRAKGVPGHMVHGLAATYYHRVFGKWPGRRGKKDFVRTPAGARRFGLPVGSYIPGTPHRGQEPKGPKPKIEKAPDAPQIIAGPGTPKKNYTKLKPIPEFQPPERYVRESDQDYAARTEKYRKLYERRNQQPRNSGDFEGMTHWEMLGFYSDTPAVPTRRAINEYTGDGYKDMNDLLRGVKSEDDLLEELSESELAATKKDIRLIQKEMLKNPAPVDMVTYRLTSKDNFPTLRKGMVFQDKGFTSTTVSAGYLDDVREELYGDEEDTDVLTMEIRVPKGTPGTYVTAYQQRRNEFDTGEQEFLLKDGTKYRVVEVTERDGRDHVVLEVVK